MFGYSEWKDIPSGRSLLTPPMPSLDSSPQPIERLSRRGTFNLLIMCAEQRESCFSNHNNHEGGEVAFLLLIFSSPPSVPLLLLFLQQEPLQRSYPSLSSSLFPCLHV